VNTGRFVGSQGPRGHHPATNLEAARRSSAQLRLRNLGGIIIVDFIDMEAPENREKVYQAFVDEMKRDRAKTHALP
jgi:ribonuclease G